LYQLNRLRKFSLFFGIVRFTSVQLTLSPSFPLSSVTFSPVDVVTPPCRVTLPSPLEPKLKHWIRTTVTGYPSCTARIPPPTAIKRLSISILITLSTTQSCLYFTSCLAKLKHHIIRALPTASIPFYCCHTSIVPPHNDTHGDKVVNPFSLFKQFIGT
jgi:hypothetical protein